MATGLGFQLLAMQKEGAMTDISFIVQGKEIQAHKNVLCCGGSKFKEMVLENAERVIIDDVSPETFTAILE